VLSVLQCAECAKCVAVCSSVRESVGSVIVFINKLGNAWLCVPGVVWVCRVWCGCATVGGGCDVYTSHRVNFPLTMTYDSPPPLLPLHTIHFFIQSTSSSSYQTTVPAETEDNIPPISYNQGDSQRNTAAYISLLQRLQQWIRHVAVNNIQP